MDFESIFEQLKCVSFLDVTGKKIPEPGIGGLKGMISGTRLSLGVCRLVVSNDERVP